MEIVKEFDLSLNIDDVLIGEGMEPDIVRTKRPLLVRAAAGALQVGNPIIHPIALMYRKKILEKRSESILLQGGEVLASPFLAHHAAIEDEIVLVISTIGSELEAYASSCMKDDPLLGIALEGLGNAAVGKVSQQICKGIWDRSQDEGSFASPPISPGLPDWPVNVGQPQIFSLLDPSLVGITPNSSGTMFPQKSISFVVGIAREMAQTGPCMQCYLREKCKYCHA
jgi:hypothetical protein